MQIKKNQNKKKVISQTAMRYHFTPSRMAIIKNKQQQRKTENNKCWRN